MTDNKSVQAVMQKSGGRKVDDFQKQNDSCTVGNNIFQQLDDSG